MRTPPKKSDRKNTPDILAGGGVVWRCKAKKPKEIEIVVIYRPRKNDWTLPKGKIEKNDTDLLFCALREVTEETGLRAVPGSYIGKTVYQTKNARGEEAKKKVYYWLMGMVSGEFIPNKEVSELRWLSLPEAEKILTFKRDKELVRSVMSSLAKASDSTAGRWEVPEHWEEQRDEWRWAGEK